MFPATVSCTVCNACRPLCQHTVQVSTLYNLLCAVHTLHVHRVVHCDLQPIQFGWFNDSQQWGLLGVSSWAHTGSARSTNMTYTLRYAPPEVAASSCSACQVAMELLMSSLFCTDHNCMLCQKLPGVMLHAGQRLTVHGRLAACHVFDLHLLSRLVQGFKVQGYAASGKCIVSICFAAAKVCI